MKIPTAAWWRDLEEKLREARDFCAYSASISIDQSNGKDFAKKFEVARKQAAALGSCQEAVEFHMGKLHGQENA